VLNPDALKPNPPLLQSQEATTVSVPQSQTHQRVEKCLQNSRIHRSGDPGSFVAISTKRPGPRSLACGRELSLGYTSSLPSSAQRRTENRRGNRISTVDLSNLEELTLGRQHQVSSLIRQSNPRRPEFYGEFSPKFITMGPRGFSEYEHSVPDSRSMSLSGGSPGLESRKKSAHEPSHSLYASSEAKVQLEYVPQAPQDNHSASYVAEYECTSPGAVKTLHSDKSVQGCWKAPLKFRGALDESGSSCAGVNVAGCAALQPYQSGAENTKSEDDAFEGNAWTFLSAKYDFAEAGCEDPEAHQSCTSLRAHIPVSAVSPQDWKEKMGYRTPPRFIAVSNDYVL
jgi:hypothetical protein